MRNDKGSIKEPASGIQKAGPCGSRSLTHRAPLPDVVGRLNPATHYRFIASTGDLKNAHQSQFHKHSNTAASITYAVFEANLILALGPTFPHRAVGILPGDQIVMVLTLHRFSSLTPAKK